MITASGTIFYQDEYGSIYDVAWETVRGNLDITSIVSQPYIWGQEVPRGYVKNHRVYRYGVVTVTRQIIKTLPVGYEIVAEGTSQYFDFIQTNFMCELVPVDDFRYHVNCGICDETETRVSDGLQYTDPDEAYSDSVWGDVLADGTPIVGTVPALEWMDVWA
jgi:hypothetical protein